MTPRMPSIKTCLSLCACLSILSSCHSSLTKDDYIRWVEDYDNGLHVKKTEGDFDFEVQYQPTSYVALQRNLSAAENLNDSLQHFILTIIPKDGQDFIDYNIQDTAEKQKRLYYFSYLFQNDIHLEESGETIPCALFHFERQSDLKKERKFVLAFEESKQKPSDVILVINSEQFGTLPVRLKITRENIPALRI